MSQRQQFSTRLATLLTMIGVAVGLGNVWRFPYMMGKFGGSAFLFIFLFFVLLFAIPAVMGEWALGRATQSGPLGAFRQAFGIKTGTLIGLILCITVLVADSYYLLVIAYIGYSAYFGAVHGFSAEQSSAYQAGLDNGYLQYVIAIVLLLITLWVLWRGVQHGIERVSVLFLPVFGLVVALLIVRALTLDGALDHLWAFLRPDMNAMMKPENIFAAMGQAFFSLSLGGTFFVVYGSYLRTGETIPGTAFWTGLGDAGAALLASLFIVPAVLVFGLELNQGPGLIFETLPMLFNQMPGGRVLGVFFLFALLLVAFLSNLAALQVLYATAQDHFKLSANRALFMIGGLEVLLILPTALNPVMIGHLDLIFGSGMQCLGSALALLALTFGLGKARSMREILGSEGHTLKGKILYYWLAIVIPLCLGVTLVIYIADQF